MSPADWLKAAHDLLAVLLRQAAGEFDGLPCIILTGEGDELKLVSVEGIEERADSFEAGLQLIAAREPDFALFGLQAEAVDADLAAAVELSADFLICALFYERDSAQVVQPVLMEWQAPARLGWYEWTPAGFPRGIMDETAAYTLKALRARKRAQ